MKAGIVIGLAVFGAAFCNQGAAAMVSKNFVAPALCYSKENDSAGHRLHLIELSEMLPYHTSPFVRFSMISKDRSMLVVTVADRDTPSRKSAEQIASALLNHWSDVYAGHHPCGDGYYGAVRLQTESGRVLATVGVFRL